MQIVTYDTEENKVPVGGENEDQLGELVMRDNRRHGYTQVVNAILTHPTLSRRAKLVYTALLYHARQKDYCWPSQRVLASECSMSVDTVQRGLKDLRDFDFSEVCSACKPGERCLLHKDGLVAWKQRGLNQSNIYCLTPLYQSYEELSGKPQNTEIENRAVRQESKKHVEKEKKNEGVFSIPFSLTVSGKMITDYSLEMHDRMHLRENLCQTRNLLFFARENLRYTEDQFCELLAFCRTQAQKACIRDVNDDGWPARMKYFFACLRNALYQQRE